MTSMRNSCTFDGHSQHPGRNIVSRNSLEAPSRMLDVSVSSLVASSGTDTIEECGLGAAILTSSHSGGSGKDMCSRIKPGCTSNGDCNRIVRDQFTQTPENISQETRHFKLKSFKIQLNNVTPSTLNFR